MAEFYYCSHFHLETHEAITVKKIGLDPPVLAPSSSPPLALSPSLLRPKRSPHLDQVVTTSEHGAI